MYDKMEKLFDPKLRLSIAEKAQLLRKAIVLRLFDKKEVIGEIYGFRIKDMGEEIEGIKTVQNSDFYLYSIAVSPKMQNCGVGKILIELFKKRIKKQGGRTLFSHAINTQSKKIHKACGGEELGKFSDWYGTGKTAVLFKIEI